MQVLRRCQPGCDPAPAFPVGCRCCGERPGLTRAASELLDLFAGWPPSLEGVLLGCFWVQVQAERDELYQKFTKAINEVQQKTGFKNLLLERKLKGLLGVLEKKEVELTEVLSASNLEPGAISLVSHKLEVLCAALGAAKAGFGEWAEPAEGVNTDLRVCQSLSCVAVSSTHCHGALQLFPQEHGVWVSGAWHCAAFLGGGWPQAWSGSTPGCSTLRQQQTGPQGHCDVCPAKNRCVQSLAWSSAFLQPAAAVTREAALAAGLVEGTRVSCCALPPSWCPPAHPVPTLSPPWSPLQWVAVKLVVTLLPECHGDGHGSSRGFGAAAVGDVTCHSSRKERATFLGRRRGVEPSRSCWAPGILQLPPAWELLSL